MSEQADGCSWVEAPANSTDLRLNQYWYSPATIGTLVAEIQSHTGAVQTSEQQGVRPDLADGIKRANSSFSTWTRTFNKNF